MACVRVCVGVCVWRVCVSVGARTCGGVYVEGDG